MGGRLLVSGSFGKRIVALNPNTGADTGYINLAIAGSVAPQAGRIAVYRFAVNPAATRLVGIGNFTTVNGSVRTRAFMLNLNAGGTTLNAWYYQPLHEMCQAASLADYLRDVDFSPDGSYFVIVSTGFVSRAGDLGSTVCDAAARFETSIAFAVPADLDQLLRRRHAAVGGGGRLGGLRRRTPALDEQPPRQGQRRARCGRAQGRRRPEPHDRPGAGLEPVQDQRRGAELHLPHVHRRVVRIGRAPLPWARPRLDRVHTPALSNFLSL